MDEENQSSESTTPGPESEPINPDVHDNPAPPPEPPAFTPGLRDDVAGEPAWVAEARAAGWNAPGQPVGPTTAAVPPAAPVGMATAGAGAPGGMPTGGAPAMGLVPTGVPPNAQPRTDQRGRYTALPGDSLPLIAEKFGHPGEWKLLYHANFFDIADPGVVGPGQELVIPPEWTEQANAEPSPQRPA